MKKIIALAMASVIAVMSLVSCGGGKYSEGGKFKKGSIADGQYVNESAGIGVKIPEGFTVSETQGLPAVENVTYELLAKDENNNVICLVSQKTEKRADINKIVDQSLEDMKEYYESGEYVIDDSKIFDCKIGGETYKAYTIDFTVGEEKFEQYAIFVICENAVVTFAYTGKDGETEGFVKANVFEA